MMRGDRVRVKLLAKLPDMDKLYRGSIRTVVVHSEHGEVIPVEFGDEVITHQFLADDLDKIKEE